MIALGDLQDEAVLAIYTDPSRSRGDREAAFSAIVARYERRVYAICYRQLGSHSDAEDATQDTFVHLARKADQFRGDSKLSTFVYRVAVNACRDLARKQARRPQTPVEDVTEAQISAGMTPDTAPDEIEGRETALEVQRALAQLDELSRTLLILCSVEGHSYPEAAEILDMPVGTIKSRVFRARARLAELLADGSPATNEPATPATAPPHRPVTADIVDVHRPRGPPAS